MGIIAPRNDAHCDSSMSNNTKRILWKLFWVANWAIIIGFWFKGSGGLLGEGIAPLALALGRLAGLTAAYMILVQFFFMGRNPFLERVFGLDKLSQIHHTNGKYGILLLLFHPVLLIYSYAWYSGVSLWTQTVNFLFQYEDVLTAAIGFVLFIAVVVVSLTIVRKRFRYESWYFVHLLAYLAVFFSYGHQFEIGEDLTGNKLFYGYFTALYIVVFFSHVLFRFIRPGYNYFKHQFYVKKVVRENYNTVSIYIGGRDLALFNIQPGQFMILRFLNKSLWWQAHPFSLSMMPDGQNLRVTVKNVGDFTREVESVKERTKVLIDGPYGVFTELFAISPKVLLIAGGIGITPVRSLAEQLSGLKKDIVLLYANRTEKDIVFKNELANIKNTKITHVISDDLSYTGEKGRLDEEKIKRLVPDFASREIFICGPPPMMNGLIAHLKTMGVSRSRLHFEKFSLH